MHGFQSGDTVTFKELTGMNALNGMKCRIEGKIKPLFAITCNDVQNGTIKIYLCMYMCMCVIRQFI